MWLAKFRTWLDWKDWLAVIVGIGVAVGLGLSNITRWGIWFDEAFSERISRYSFFDIARYTAADVHPPLYYWVLKVWRTVFGGSEIALRSLSLVFLACALVIAYVFIRKVFSRRAALISLVFLAVAPMLFRYGIEARMYTMELAIVLAATATLSYAINNRSRRAWLVYGALVGAGMLTHYLSVVVWVSHAAWLWYINRQPTMRTTMSRLLATGYGASLKMVLAITALWAPFMVWQIINIQGGGFWIGAVSFDTIPNLLSNLYLYQDANKVQNWLAVLLAVVLASSIYCAARATKSLKGEKKRVLSLLLFSVILPPIFLVLGSMPPLRSSFVERYLLASIALWLVVSGIALSFAWDIPKFKKPAKAVTFLTAVVLLIGISGVYSVGNLNKDNGSVHTMRQAMQIANTKAAGNEPIIVDSSWRYFEASYYEKAPHTVYFRSEDNTKVGAYTMLRQDVNHKILVMSDFGKNHPVAWYVTAQGRSEQSRLPRGWREVGTYLVDEPSELRVVKMEYVGDGI